MENLKGSFIRPFDKSHGGEVFSVRIDQQTKETLKAVFIKLLNQISTNVQVEQTFCNEFFTTKKQKHEDSVSTSTTSNNNNSSNQPNQLSRNPSFSSGSSNSAINKNLNE
jgi:hypothetical protein